MPPEHLQSHHYFLFLQFLERNWTITQLVFIYLRGDRQETCWTLHVYFYPTWLNNDTPWRIEHAVWTVMNITATLPASEIQPVCVQHSPDSFNPPICCIWKFTSSPHADNENSSQLSVSNRIIIYPNGPIWQGSVATSMMPYLLPLTPV